MPNLALDKSYWGYYHEISMQIRNRLQAPIVVLVTFLTYFFTVISATKSYALQAIILYLFFVLLGLSYILFFREKNKEQNPLVRDLMIYAVMVLVLLWVGVTGWFISPFFYLLYLLGIALAFLFSPLASFAYVLVLTLVFLPNVGSIDLSLDIAQLISLFSIIPLTHVLRSEYLKLRESEKKILILQDEKKPYKTSAEEVLSNKMSRFGVTLREPISDIRQLALFAKKLKEEAEREKNRTRIVSLAEKALRRLREFEEETTGTKLVTSSK